MPKSATAVDPMVKPDPNLERRIRRVFTGDYKLSIIQQADACKHGELGASLRREKLYAGQLLQWRREMAEHGVQGLSKSSPGPAPLRSTEDKRIEQLERENARFGKPEIINTDQGSQFTAQVFVDKVLDRGVKLSMDG